MNRRWVAAVVAVVAAAWIAWVIVSLVQHAGEHDKYGRMDVPGTAVMELPGDEIAVSYFEDVSLPENETLDLPADLRVSVSPLDGPARRSLGLRDPGLSTEEWEDSSGTGRRVAEIDVPVEGRYRVVASGASGRKDPEVLLGPSTAFLGTPPGIALLVGIALIVVAAIAWSVRTLRQAR